MRIRLRTIEVSITERRGIARHSDGDATHLADRQDVIAYLEGHIESALEEASNLVTKPDARD